MTVERSEAAFTFDAVGATGSWTGSSLAGSSRAINMTFSICMSEWLGAPTASTSPPCGRSGAEVPKASEPGVLFFVSSAGANTTAEATTATDVRATAATVAITPPVAPTPADPPAAVPAPAPATPAEPSEVFPRATVAAPPLIAPPADTPCAVIPPRINGSTKIFSFEPRSLSSA